MLRGELAAVRHATAMLHHLVGRRAIRLPRPPTGGLGPLALLLLLLLGGVVLTLLLMLLRLPPRRTASVVAAATVGLAAHDNPADA